MIKLIDDFIDRVSHFKILIVGETIIDEFVPVCYEGQSMKSFCPVFKLSDGLKQTQLGGTSAIANHLRSFVKKLDLLTNENNEIVKTRYFDVNDGKKHIEINKFDNKNFKSLKVDTNDYDLVIVADFGHGFCDKLEINDGFCLMTQTNSNNFGFNRASKWKNKRKRSVCIDLREASLQMNKKIGELDNNTIKELYNYELFTNNLFVTTGKKGSVFYNGLDIIKQPSFATNIADTIGAGDAFYGFSCLLTAMKDKELMKKYMFIPSLAASLTTTWVCNEKSVNPENLQKHAFKYI